MLAEARVISGGGRSQERKEARMRKDSSLRETQEMDLAEKEEREFGMERPRKRLA